LAHDRAGAEHFRATYRQARGVFIDDLGDEFLRLVAPILGAVGLRIDDDIGQEKVVS
jgi:hypothetical protein